MKEMRVCHACGGWTDKWIVACDLCGEKAVEPPVKAPEPETKEPGNRAQRRASKSRRRQCLSCGRVRCKCHRGRNLSNDGGPH